MDITKLKGSIVALVTPFNGDGSINFEKLGELIELKQKEKKRVMKRTTRSVNMR